MFVIGSMQIWVFWKNAMLICILLTTSILYVPVVKPYIEYIDGDESCTGFIIPLPAGNDTTIETLVNSRARFLVNDLLRENVDVFWTLKPGSAMCISLTENMPAKEVQFERGAFIVPFTGDNASDQLITAVMVDYNVVSEIDEQPYVVDIFCLMGAIEISALKLAEPQIAQHFALPVRYGWPCYLQIAEAGGFLTFDFLLDGETSSKLNLKDYNVFMWPYEPNPARFSEVVLSLSNKIERQSIRSFVCEGGGYVGSCYGALAASSGFLNPFSGVHLFQAYLPPLSCLPFSFTMCMSDSLMMERAEVLEELYVSYSKIHNHTHPITFGINETVKEFFSGPWFVWQGKNTESVSTFTELTLGENITVPSFIKNQVEQSPSWTVSTFGKGDMVLFSSHPEFINNITFLFEKREWSADQYYGRRVVFNAIMYAAAEEVESIPFDMHRPLSFINVIQEKTCSLEIPSVSDTSFEVLKERFANYRDNLTVFRQQTHQLMALYSILFNESIVYPSQSRPLLYTYAFCSILQDYVNKTLDVLQMLDNIKVLCEKSDSMLPKKLAMLYSNLSEKLNHTEEIFLRTEIISNEILELFQHPVPPFHEKSRIVEQSRNMLVTFEISLKYLPQMYFESLKLLRHEWYHYESMMS